MRWFTYWELRQRREVHLNLNNVLWWALEEWDADDDNGPVIVAIQTVDGNSWNHHMSNSDYQRLDRLLLDYENTPTELQAVASW